MEELAANFPDDLEYDIVYDATEYISASIDEVINTLIVAIILVIFVVWIFLQDWRTTLIPAITIPVSLIGTFAVMLGLGMSINNLTLFGLVLVIGIVVDDAIVVVENTVRLMTEKGWDRARPVTEGMREVTGPVDRHHPGAAGGVRAHPDDARPDRPAVHAVRHHHLDRHGLLLDQRADPEPGAVPPAAEAGLDQPKWSSFRWFNRIHRARATSGYEGAVSGMLRKCGLVDG